MICDDVKSVISIINNASIISDTTYKKLVEAALDDVIQSKYSDLTHLCPTKPDVIKEVYAGIVKILLHFTQNNFSNDKAYIFIAKECKLDINRSRWLVQQYVNNKMVLIFKIGNIGSHLPHIVDIEWEIDVLIKLNVMDNTEGPLFKVKLITEQFCKKAKGAIQDNIIFWCTNQEMQDLVYKLEDALRHCQKISSGH